MSESKSFLSRFFGGVWAVCIGVYRLITIVLALATLAILWYAFRGGAPVKVEENVALVINPSGRLVEQDADGNRTLLRRFSGEAPSQTSVHDLVESLTRAAKDKRIGVAVLKLDDLDGAGLAQIEEVADAVKIFRASGKRVYARGDDFDQYQYLLASSADEISLDPLGGVTMTGFGLYTNYFKDALDKLGVEVNIFRVGEYKSAVEPFERNDMSADAKTADSSLLKDLWGDYNQRLADARGLTGTPADAYVSTFPASLQQLKGDGASLAKASKLVDTVEPIEDFRKRVGTKVGMDDEIDSFRQIGYDDYLRSVQGSEHHKPADKVVVVAVEGDIVDGSGDPDEAGSDTIADELAQVRRDDNVAAVVLRVNSPGGSVTGAEKIRRAVQAIQDDGTPVVVSMSTLAASGGYWISMGADEIWAHDATITGSIGIFGMFPTISRPLEKIGIHTDGVGTTNLAGALRMDRPMTPEMRTILQSQIDFGYQQFIQGVAKGRDLPVDQVDQMARGRVWSGAAAKQLGLVDEIGGLDEAAASAAELAGLKEGEYQLVSSTPDRSFTQTVINELRGDSSLTARLFGRASALNSPMVDRALALTQALRSFRDPRGMYAYCFCSPDSGR